MTYLFRHSPGTELSVDKRPKSVSESPAVIQRRPAVRMEQLPVDQRSLAGRVLNIPANAGGSFRNVLSA
jgi:hypothetical protein